MTCGLVGALFVHSRSVGHEPGRIARDICVMPCDGGDCLTDLGALRDQGCAVRERGLGSHRVQVRRAPECGRPVVFVSDTTSASATARQRAMLRVLSSVVSAVWVLGKASRSLWLEYGMRPNLVFEGCHCLDVNELTLAEARHPERREDTRRRLDIARDLPVALFVGRMVAECDTPSLMTSFETVASSIPCARLVVVGHGPYRRWAEEYARCRGVAEVTFLGPVRNDELMPLCAAADVYVQPSLWEPYSLSTAQAGSMGLAIVCTDAVGATEDYVVGGVTGYRVTTGNAAALAKALCELLGNVRPAGQMGQAARAAALQRFSMDRYADNLERVYRYAAGSRCGRGGKSCG